MNKNILITILGLVVIFNILTLMDFLPGFPQFDPVIVDRKDCPPFEGPLKINDKLSAFEKLFPDELEGPESFAVFEDDICTGLATGKIVCIRNGKVRFITQTGDSSCEGRWEEETCGRPLGLRFDKNGTLYVADAYYGLYKINIQTGDKTLLYDSNREIGGRKSYLVNDLDVTKDGDVYFTDSGIYPLKIMIFAMLETNPRGRIFHYNSKTNETKVIVSGLNFANGIQLSPNEEFLIVSETPVNRISRYYLRGPKKGNLEVFIHNLPGFPDNIRLNDRGNYWVAMCGARTPDHFPLLPLINKRTLIRKHILQNLHMFMNILKLSHEHLPFSMVLKQLHYWIGHMHVYASIGSPSHGLIVELNQQGEIVQSLHDPTGSIKFISEVREHNGSLYLGTVWNNFMSKLEFRFNLTSDVTNTSAISNTTEMRLTK